MARRKKDRFGLRGEVHFQMAPLIDVVFLLLIFFICVTQFKKADKVDLMLAYAETAEKYEEGKGVLLVNVRSDGWVIISGENFRPGDKEGIQTKLEDIVAEAGHAAFMVAIRADRQARMKYVKDVYRAAAHAGLTRISLVTTKRPEGVLITGPTGPLVPAPQEGEEDLIY